VQVQVARISVFPGSGTETPNPKLQASRR
jgi:hypothetical protein